MDDEHEDTLPPDAFEEVPVREPIAPKVDVTITDYLLPASILIAAVLIAGAIIYAVGAGRGGGANILTTTSGNSTSTSIMTLTGNDVILGNQNAPVTAIEYGDYQCPFCAKFFKETEPQIRANYIQAGKVKMIFRNLAFLGPESISAAAAAECAKDRSQFWAYHDALYRAKIQDTQNGGSENDGFFTPALFTKLATDLKLDVGTFSQCVSAKKYDAQVTAETKQAATDLTQALGPSGVSTPTTFVNGQAITGAQPYSVFQTAIDAALAKT